MSTFYNKMKEIRKDADETQRNIANYLQITQEQYSLYETGKRYIPVDLLKSFCEYFHVSADYILGLDPELDWPRGKGEKRYSSGCTKYIFLYVINGHLLVITNASAHPGVRCKGFRRPGLRYRLAMGRLALALTARISLHRLRALRRSLTKAEENSITNKRRKAGLSACFNRYCVLLWGAYRKSL